MNILKNKITGISGIDTRALTKMIRSQGAMRGIISNEDISEPRNYTKRFYLFPK